MERHEIALATYNLLDEARSDAVRGLELDIPDPTTDFGYIDIAKKAKRLYGAGEDISLDFKYTYRLEEAATLGMSSLDKGGVICDLQIDLRLDELDEAPPENSRDFIIYLHLLAHKIVIRKMLERRDFIAVSEAWIMGDEIYSTASSYAMLLHIKSSVKDEERLQIKVMLTELFKTLLDNELLLTDDLLTTIAEISAVIALGGDNE